MELRHSQFVFFDKTVTKSSDEQAEVIADQFAKISNLYQPLKSDEIEIPSIMDSEPHPLFEPYQIYKKVQSMKKKTSTVPNDIPWRIMSEFSAELATPLSNIYNNANLSGPTCGSMSM